MAKVAVVTDSVASIPEALIEELQIHWAAYYIHRGQEVLRDLVTVQRDAFYDWLGTAVTIPKTAAPSPADYLQIYENLADAGVRDIISIHITSKASAAYQSAKIAQEMALERIPDMKIAVIDTLHVAMCQGWMTIEAARAAQAGKSMVDIVQLVRKMMPVTQLIQTADTLRYLHWGGRIGKAQYLVGSLLSIKPSLA